MFFFLAALMWKTGTIVQLAPGRNLAIKRVLLAPTTKAVSTYLPPSPATSKGHMKRPCKGLHSTTPKVPCLATPNIVPDVAMPNLHIEDKDKDISHDRCLHNFIDDINNHSVVNIFCFGAFADKTTGVLYNDCTSKPPFMSPNGNVCFFVMYLYKINAILATPIPGLDNASILATYTKNFEYLINKGYKQK
jgi:hypothetical protein